MLIDWETDDMAMGKSLDGNRQPGWKNGRPGFRSNDYEMSTRLGVYKGFVFYIFQPKAGVRKTLSYIKKITGEREGPSRYRAAQSRSPPPRTGRACRESAFPGEVERWR
jgi:hypothetical protein